MESKVPNDQESDRELWLHELRDFIVLAGFNEEICVVRQSYSTHLHACVRSEKGQKLLDAIIELTSFAKRIPRIQTYVDQPSQRTELPQKIESFPPEIRNAAFDLHLG